MKWQRFILTAVLSVLPIFAGAAKGAAADSDDPAAHDGRTEGYTNPVKVESNSTGMTWVLFIFMSAVCLGVLFKDSGRSRAK